MREIIFRGKERTGILNHAWLVGALDNTNEESPKIISPDRYGNPMFVDVAPETVGQFTGLTDKNGKRIFEGDILKVQTRVYVEEDNPVFGKMKEPSEEKRTRYWVVEWGNQTCGGASWYSVEQRSRSRIGEFCIPCPTSDCKDCKFYKTKDSSFELGAGCECTQPTLKRPPQSFCYVEEAY